MKFIRIIIFLSLLALLSQSASYSQSIMTSDYNSYSIGAKGGFMYFYGDVRQMKYASDNPYKKINLCVGLEVTKNLNNIFGTRLGAMIGGLSGSSPNLDLHFTTQLQQYTLEGILNQNDLFSIYPKKEKIINTYPFAGIGVINFRSKVYTFVENTFVQGFGWDTSGNNKTKERLEMVYPFGLGVKYKAGKKIDIGLEFSMQLTNTDKLDAWMVAHSYMDRYSNLTASITYKIGGKKEYVDWVNPFADTGKTLPIVAQNSVIANNNPPNTNKTGNISAANNNVSTTGLKDFYVFAGDFSSKKLANEEADDQKKKGYAVGDITNETTYGYWLLIYKVYLTADEAKADYANIKKMNVNAKLYEKKGIGDYTEIPFQKPVTADTAKTIAKTNTTKQKADTSAAGNKAKTNVTITPVKTTSNNNTTQTTPTKTTTLVKKFFIIAGSFASEQMAETGVAALIAKGYKDAEVVGKNDAGNWRICFKAYATRADADKDLPDIKAKNPSAWIFEKK